MSSSSPPSPPLLSIITPAYNAAAFLPTLAACVRDAQTALLPFGALEWIIIDDGSTDETATLAEAYVKQHAGWRLYRQQNAGLSATRNVGLGMARGQYVWFVDADDEIVPGAMTALGPLLASGVDVFSFQAQRFGAGIDESSDKTLIYKPSVTSAPVSGEIWLQQKISRKEWRHFAWIYLFRRQFLQEHQLQFDIGLLHEDVPFTTRTTLCAKSIQYVDVLAYRYRINPASITGSQDDAKRFARIDSYFRMVEILREINRQQTMSSETRKLLESEVIGQAIQIFEIAKSLQSAAMREDVRQRARRVGLAQSLMAEAHSWKRKRQVFKMWAQQAGFVSVGEA
jgi:heptose III glucuronosyltransferase